jgi:putative ABC transport system substrate-binding protein
MRRREFLNLVGGIAATFPHAALAQQGQPMRRIGVLQSAAEDDLEAQRRLAVFREGLHKLGWTEGSNIQIDVRWAAADRGLMRKHAAELARTAPDVILAVSPPALAAVQQQTRTIPTVFIQVGDPVGTGFIPSLSKPGGNITGFTNFEFAMGGKWLELLKEIAPSATQVLVILMADHTVNAGTYRAMEAVAPKLDAQLTPAIVRDAAEIERSIDGFARRPNAGLVVLQNPLATVQTNLIVRSAAKHRIPAIYPFRYFAVAGGLVSYGSELINLWQQPASYVDRILKGERPADLPVQAPTKFELVINLNTAKALGLAVSPTLLARADEVIE